MQHRKQVPQVSPVHVYFRSASPKQAPRALLCFSTPHPCGQFHDKYCLSSCYCAIRHCRQVHGLPIDEDTLLRRHASGSLPMECNHYRAHAVSIRHVHPLPSRNSLLPHSCFGLTPVSNADRYSSTMQPYIHKVRNLEMVFMFSDYKKIAAPSSKAVTTGSLLTPYSRLSLRIKYRNIPMP